MDSEKAARTVKIAGGIPVLVIPVVILLNQVAIRGLELNPLGMNTVAVLVMLSTLALCCARIVQLGSSCSSDVFEGKMSMMHHFLVVIFISSVCVWGLARQFGVVAAHKNVVASTSLFESYSQSQIDIVLISLMIYFPSIGLSFLVGRIMCLRRVGNRR